MLTCSKCGRFIAHPGAPHACEPVGAPDGAKSAQQVGAEINSNLDTMIVDREFMRSLDNEQERAFQSTMRLTNGQIKLLKETGKTWITPRQGREGP